MDPQTPEIIEQLVKNFLDAEFAKLKSKNTMNVSYEAGGLPWVGNKDSWNFQAADAATQVRVPPSGFCGCPPDLPIKLSPLLFLFFSQTVHGTTLAPDYTREGGSIPLALLLQEELDTNVLLLPMGRSDDGAQ